MSAIAKTARKSQQRGFSIMEVVVSSVILTAGAMTALGITNMMISTNAESRDVGRGATIARQEIERQRALTEPEDRNETVDGYRILTTSTGCAWGGSTLVCDDSGEAAWEITVQVTGGIQEDTVILRTVRYNGRA